MTFFNNDFYKIFQQTRNVPNDLFTFTKKEKTTKKPRSLRSATYCTWKSIVAALQKRI